MTCRAILHSDGTESIPLLLVRNGDLTPRQCDHEFKGLTGDCPSCKFEIEQTDFSDGSSYAAAMAKLRDRGPTVKYRSFGYGSDGGVEPWRICHWGHPPGYWNSVPYRDCQNADRDTHKINLQVIKRYYEKKFQKKEGYLIRIEQRLRRPGDPPRAYSPDLAIYGKQGERLIAVEYQRSYEPFDKFLDRDELRRIEGWKAVDWWFDDTQIESIKAKPRQTVYSKSQMHRTYLAAMSVYFFKCWVDQATLVLQADYGVSGNKPPDRKKRQLRHLEKAEMNECSTSNLINRFRSEPEWSIVKNYETALRPRHGTELDFKGNLNYSLERQARIAQATLTQQQRLERQDKEHRAYVARTFGSAQTIVCSTDEEEKNNNETHSTVVSSEDKSLAFYQDDEWEIVEGRNQFVRGVEILKTRIAIGDVLRKSNGSKPVFYTGISSLGYTTTGGTYESLIGWQILKSKNNKPASKLFDRRSHEEKNL